MKLLLFILLFPFMGNPGEKELLETALQNCRDLKRLEKVEDLLERYGLREKIPLFRPIRGTYRVSSGYGSRTHPVSGKAAFHTGIDLAVELATPVFAAASGKAVFAGKKGGYGRCIVIRHSYGFSTLYGHLSAYYLRQGEEVRQGQPIGFVGSTGRSTGNHLHYEVRKNNRSIEPYINIKQ